MIDNCLSPTPSYFCIVHHCHGICWLATYTYSCWETRSVHYTECHVFSLPAPLAPKTNTTVTSFYCTQDVSVCCVWLDHRNLTSVDCFRLLLLAVFSIIKVPKWTNNQRPNQKMLRRSQDSGALLGDGVAQLVERQTPDPKTRGSNHVCVRSTRKIVIIFQSQKCCADSLSVCVRVTLVCIRTHTNDHVRTLKIL